jgi:hypothetical protein
MDLGKSVLDLVGIADVFENKNIGVGGIAIFKSAGGPDFKIPEIEKSFQHPLDVDREVLDPGQVELGNLSSKKSVLIGADQPLVGDYPIIKIIVDPESGQASPQKKPPERGKKPEGTLNEKFRGLYRAQKSGQYKPDKQRQEKKRDDPKKNQN